LVNSPHRLPEEEVNRFIAQRIVDAEGPLEDLQRLILRGPSPVHMRINGQPVGFKARGSRGPGVLMWDDLYRDSNRTRERRVGKRKIFRFWWSPLSAVHLEADPLNGSDSDRRLRVFGEARGYRFYLRSSQSCCFLRHLGEMDQELLDRFESQGKAIVDDDVDPLPRQDLEPIVSIRIPPTGIPRGAVPRRPGIPEVARPLLLVDGRMVLPFRTKLPEIRDPQEVAWVLERSFAGSYHPSASPCPGSLEKIRSAGWKEAIGCLVKSIPAP